MQLSKTCITEGVFTPGKSASSLALVQTKYSANLFILFLGVVRFHTALFASEPEIVNKTTRVLRSSIQLYQSLFGAGPRPPLQLGPGIVVWSAFPSAIAVFTPAQKIRTKVGNELEFD